MPYCTFEHHCFRDICWFSVKTTLVNQRKVSTQNGVMQISNLTLNVCISMINFLNKSYAIVHAPQSV